MFKNALTSKMYILFMNIVYYLAVGIAQNLQHLLHPFTFERKYITFDVAH